MREISSMWKFAFNFIGNNVIKRDFLFRDIEPFFENVFIA